MERSRRTTLGELKAINSVFDLTNSYSLGIAIIWTAMSRLKDNPSLTIEEVINYSLEDLTDKGENA